MLFWINGNEYTAPTQTALAQILANSADMTHIDKNPLAPFLVKDSSQEPPNLDENAPLFILDVISYKLINKQSGCQLLCATQNGQLIVVHLQVPKLWFVDLTQNDLTTQEAAFNFMDTLLLTARQIQSDDIELKQGMFVNKSNTDLHYWVRVYTRGLNPLRDLLKHFGPPYTRTNHVPPNGLENTLAFGKSAPHLAYAGIKLQTWAQFGNVEPPVKLKGAPGIYVTTAHITNLKILDHIYDAPPVSMASFDIEVANNKFLTTSATLPDIDDPANIISHISLNIRHPLMEAKEWALNLNCATVPHIVQGQTTITASNEEILMRIFIEIINLVRPFMLLDYNGYCFDQNWIIRKIEQYNLCERIFNILTYGDVYFTQNNWKNLTYMRVKLPDEQGNRTMASVSSLNGIGMTHLDVFYYIKNTGVAYDKTKGASLNAMADHFHLPRKLDISFMELNMAIYVDQLIAKLHELNEAEKRAHINLFVTQIEDAISKFIIGPDVWTKICGLSNLQSLKLDTSNTQSLFYILRDLACWAINAINQGIEYCQRDAFICFEVAHNIGIFPTIIASCSEDSTTPHEVVVRGNTFFVIRCYAHESYLQNVFVAAERYQSNNTNDVEWMLQAAESHIGGITLQPRRSDINNPEYVLLYDIDGSYPSHIKNWDLCPTKFNLHPPDGPHHRILIPIEWTSSKIQGLLDSGITFIKDPLTNEPWHINDYHIDQETPQLYLPVYFRDDKNVGIMDRVQTHIKIRRSEIKGALNELKTEKNSNNQHIIQTKMAYLDGQNKVLKRKAVSAYGFTGWRSDTSNPFCSQLLMTSITATSAQSILKIIEHIFLNFGIVPISGVTDSAMFAIPQFIFDLFGAKTVNEKYKVARQLGLEIKAEINAYLKMLYNNNFVQVDFDGLAYPFWGIVMKRYCYMSLNLRYSDFAEAYKNGERIIKGYTCVRRNSSQFCISIFERLIKIVLAPQCDSESRSLDLNINQMLKNPHTMADNIKYTARLAMMQIFSNHMRSVYICGSTKYSAPPLLLERYNLAVRDTYLNNSYLLSGRSRHGWKVGERLVYAQDILPLGLSIDFKYIYSNCLKAINEVLGTDHSADSIEAQFKNLKERAELTRPNCSNTIVREVGQNLASYVDPSHKCILMWISISCDPLFNTQEFNTNIIHEPKTTNELVALWRNYVEQIIYEEFVATNLNENTIMMNILRALEISIAEQIPPEIFDFICGSRIMFAYILDGALAIIMNYIMLNEEYIKYFNARHKPQKKTCIKNLVSELLPITPEDDTYWASTEIEDEYPDLNDEHNIKLVIEAYFDKYGLDRSLVFNALWEYEKKLQQICRTQIKTILAQNKN